MNDHMMQGMQIQMVILWAIIAVIGLMVAALLIFFGWRAPRDTLLVADIAAGSPNSFPSFPQGTHNADMVSAPAQDTLFILPDISHYTRFMTGNQFAFAHAQHIIFSLINAMIEAATKTLELSKLEGDAALFFVDAERYTDSEIGQTIMNIFAAFYREQKRLIESNICLCGACRHIKDLDLKVFVHRGQATRFKFRGSVDHFGTDVIILHRMMKNGVRGHRYVMVTAVAKDSVKLPGQFQTYHMEENVDHIGKIQASVFDIDDAKVAELTLKSAGRRPSVGEDFRKKLRQNLRSIRSAFGMNR